MEYKTQKMFFVFKKIAFEQGTANSHNPEHDTYNQQSIYVNKHHYGVKRKSGRYFPNHFSSQ